MKNEYLFKVNTEKLLKSFFKLFIPLYISNFLANASGFIGFSIASDYSKSFSAPGSLIASTQIFLTLTSSAMLYGIFMVIPGKFSNEENIKIAPIFQYACLMALILSVFIILVMHYIEPLLLILGQDKNNSHIVQSYMHYYSIGVIPNMLLVVCMFFLMSINKQNVLMLVSLLTCVLEYLLSTVLIHFMYAAGLGLARAIQAWLIMVVMLIYLLNSKDVQKLKLFKLRFKNNVQSFAQLIKLGLPVAVFVFVQLLVMFILTMFVGWVGNVQLAIYQAASQYLFLCLPIFYSLSQASCILVSQLHEQGLYDALRMLSLINFVVSISIAIIFGFILSYFWHALASLFIDTRNIYAQALARSFFIFTACGLVLYSINELVIGVLRGIKDTAVPSLINLGTIIIILLPSAYILTIHSWMNLNGIGFAQCMGLGISSSVLIIRWHKKIWYLGAENKIPDRKQRGIFTSHL